MIKTRTNLTHTLKEVVDSDVIFLSVPTPSNPDGSMNVDIVDSVLGDIKKMELIQGRYNITGVLDTLHYS